MKPAHRPLALRRWQRLALGVRLAFQPDSVAAIARCLRLGRRLSAAGLLDERDMLQRSLRLLWQCAEDPELPPAWRAACLDQAARPLARHAALWRGADPLGVLLWQQRLAGAAARLPAAPLRH